MDYDVYFMTGSDNAAQWQDEPANSFKTKTEAVAFARAEAEKWRPETPTDGGIRAWEIVTVGRNGRERVVAAG